MNKLLIINPGSTSTKIGVYNDEQKILIKTLRHSPEEIKIYDSVADQKDFRRDSILKVLNDEGIDIKSFDAIVGRGGLLKPIEGGTYEVNSIMLKDCKAAKRGEHASNLGAILSSEIADEIGVKAYIVDPVVVDELDDVARRSGISELSRKSIFHALNQKAVAKRFALENEKDYKDISLIVVHMGGGVSVGAHKKGRIIDVNNALDGEGSFSPERSGGVPSGDLVRLCFSGKYTEKEVLKKISGNGGMISYLNTSDMVKIMKDVEEEEADTTKVYESFVYQIAKDIGSMATVLRGRVDGIILTGGIAHSDRVIDDIAKRVSFIAPITVYPGEDEMLALAKGALEVLEGGKRPRKYR